MSEICIEYNTLRIIAYFNLWSSYKWPLWAMLQILVKFGIL